MNWIDKSFDLHAKALMLRSERNDVLARNIANSETPGFQARDLDFRTVLENTGSEMERGLTKSHPRHLSADETNSGGQLVYRLPVQTPREGNTVEIEVEKSAFTQNAIQYQASAQFLDGAIKGLLLAIKGQ